MVTPVSLTPFPTILSNCAFNHVMKLFLMFFHYLYNLYIQVKNGFAHVEFDVCAQNIYKLVKVYIFEASDQWK